MRVRIAADGGGSQQTVGWGPGPAGFGAPARPGAARRPSYFMPGSPVGGGAWSTFRGGPSSSVSIGFRASAQT